MENIENIGKVAYIASPVARYISAFEYDVGVLNAKNHAARIATIAKTRGYIPVSVPLMFLDVYDEREEREVALEACFSILKKCDVFFYDRRDLHKSEGMRCELKFAQENGITIVAI